MKSVIIYATKYGCTEKAANILKQKMSGDVILVNIMQEKISSLEGYDIVILGGSIYIGKIQKKLTEYITNNLTEILKKKVGLFICAGQKEDIRLKELETAFPTELYNQAVVKDIFGYEFDFEKLNFLDRLIVRKVSGITESKFELSSEAIERFAKLMMV